MDSIFNPSVSLEKLNLNTANTLAQTLGIEYTEIGLDYLEAKMPVDNRTKQPYGVLNGGASLALAETVGSAAANCVLKNTNTHCVGMEINGNHIRPVSKGFVIARASPIHLGNKTHVWEIRIKTEENKLACIARLTLAVVENN